VRNNGLARTISESNLKGRGTSALKSRTGMNDADKEEQMKMLVEKEALLLKPRELQLSMAQAHSDQGRKRSQRYAAAFSRLEQWGIPVMRVSYERLLEVPETMIQVMRFVGANVSEVQVGPCSHFAAPHF